MKYYNVYPSCDVKNEIESKENTCYLCRDCHLMFYHKKLDLYRGERINSQIAQLVEQMTVNH